MGSSAWPAAYFMFGDMNSAPFALIVLCCVLSCGAPATAWGQSEQLGNVARGAAFAEEHCARCHAVGAEGASPYAPAPAFRTLHERYPVENLAEALAEGLVVQHQGPVAMPEFVLDTEGIDDLLAYLRSLEPR